MRFEKKIRMLEDFETLSKLTGRQLAKVIQLSNDRDPFVRSQVAAFLVLFRNDISKNILLRLACDKNSLVRMEAYDSLGIFRCKDVELFLKEAMQKEKSKLACSFAILSWADIASVINENIFEERSLVSKMKQSSRICQSEHCVLSCCYAQYKFGMRKSLNKIMNFLKSEDYRVRCAAINILKDLVDDDNKEMIKEAVMSAMKEENTVAARSAAETFLKELAKSFAG